MTEPLLRLGFDIFKEFDVKDSIISPVADASIVELNTLECFVNPRPDEIAQRYKTEVVIQIGPGISAILIYLRILIVRYNFSINKLSLYRPERKT